MTEANPVPATSGTAEAAARPREIVIVIGPGRSGTSTIAGALAKSGFEVPGKAIGGNRTNPSGFFEPRWVVDLHKELLDTAGVGTMDTSPDALDRAREAADSSAVRERLRDWLGERLDEQPRLVVKDPRTVWFKDLWVDTARQLGVEPGFVTMLRHPAEVSASRQKYYSKNESGADRAGDIRRIAGWTNVALIAEQVTQGSPRSFVRYTDLVTDWRSVLASLGDSLGLAFEPAIDTQLHPVDDFIDPSLHRVQVDWESVELPDALRELAEETWASLVRLADGEQSGAVADSFTEIRASYERLTSDALALNEHEIRRRETLARRQGRRQGRRQARDAAPSAEPARPVALWRRLTGNAR